MKWITRERPKIDRIACPWLIKRFIDKDAQIIYVPLNKVLPEAKKLNATPFDIAGVEYTHYKDKCTFDYFIEKHKLNEPALKMLSVIVRGADTDRPDLASQSAGLWAISAGLAHNYKDDQQMLEKGMIIYDALYSWAKFHKDEKHTQNPSEQLLLEIFERYLSERKTKKIPAWANEIKELIQDHIDTNITLKQFSKELDIHPAYLSREFSKYFNDLSFGDYTRKLRIDKAIEYLKTTNYPLTKIAYLTGFSDQSHFTRIFKKHMKENPSVYRKKIH
jgi:AraC-like DNA-binding protein